MEQQAIADQSEQVVSMLRAAPAKSRRAKRITTATAALKEAQKRWGKNGCVRDEGVKRASSPAKRAAAKLACQEMRIALTQTELRSKEHRDEWDRVLWDCGRYRYSVGSVELGMFFAVKGQGDSWDEAFAAADKK